MAVKRNYKEVYELLEKLVMVGGAKEVLNEIYNVMNKAKSMKKLNLDFEEVIILTSLLMLPVSLIINQLLGNNYRDIYNPFWINVSGIMLVASIAIPFLCIAAKELFNNK